MKIRRLLALCLAILMVGCGEESSDDTGHLSVSLSDATTAEYNAVYVTIEEIDVHLESDTEDQWTLVSRPRKTLNLLELINGVQEDLGLVSLAVGHYTQMRLMIGDTADSTINVLSQSHPYANYVIDSANEYHELKVPSGVQTGVKIVQGFYINVNGTTELTLDFDASQSVVLEAGSGNYILEPTIKMISPVETSILTGTATKTSGFP